MKKNWQTFGHNSVKDLLDRQISSGTLFHAYVFLGPVGIGKQTLAREFAEKLLETSPVSNHPDFHYFDAESLESVEQVRAFITPLHQKPFMGNFNFAVIDNAQLLNKESSNALLKTMEEPTPSTIIVLISQTRNLLPTIMSRSMVLNFSPLADRDFQSFVKDQKTASSDLVTLSLGNPGKLDWFLKGGEEEQELQTNLALLQKAENGNLFEKLLAVEQLAALDTVMLKRLLVWWSDSKKISLKTNPKHFKLLLNISEASSLLNTAMNKKNILQKLLVTSN